MTDIRERLTPPREPLTPAAHYEIADRLLAELTELRPHELQLPYAKAKLALADIHARLAGCVVPERRTESLNVPLDREPPSGVGANCAHCGLVIRYSRLRGWYHPCSGRAECFRDPQHTETAAPETATPAERI